MISTLIPPLARNPISRVSDSSSLGIWDQANTLVKIDLHSLSEYPFLADCSDFQALYLGCISPRCGQLEAGVLYLYPKLRDGMGCEVEVRRLHAPVSDSDTIVRDFSYPARRCLGRNVPGE